MNATITHAPMSQGAGLVMTQRVVASSALVEVAVAGGPESLER
jgi:hypothetical protein